MKMELSQMDEEVHRKYHEIANIFPLMQGEEFEALKQDIAGNGLLEPIWLHPDGSIIDGRNRHRACMELDIQPEFRTWNDNGSLVSFVVSLNLHRRHLSAMQRAAVAVDILPMLEEEAKGRRLSTLKQNQTDSQNFDYRGKSTDQAASLMGANHQYVSDAKRYKEQAPEVYEMARSGTINGSQAKQLASLPEQRRAQVLQVMKDDGIDSVRAATREIQHRERQEASPLPTDEYRIWYADPPWNYGNSGVISDSDNYGRAERHYPTMSIEQLCSMGPEIRDRCTDDAVLFLWVTSPLLAECFDVIKAWGFKYKTSFVWDKVGHNYGHYNSVRHELLLICTRGSCTPDNKQLFDSVVEIPKTNVHSEKPERFREIIDTLYTHGNRIELFSRKCAEGWETWGNEPN